VAVKAGEAKGMEGEVTTKKPVTDTAAREQPRYA
jgi:hypothetical protein